MIHFLQELMDSWAIGTNCTVSINSSLGNFCAWQSLRLRNQRNNIHTEAVNSLFTPTTHHIENFFSDNFIFPVQIRLLLGEEVEIELPGLLIKYPSRSGEEGAPVVGRKKLFSPILHNISCKALLLFLRYGGQWSSLAPNVVISLGIFLVLTALHKPGMLIGAVVYYQIHHNLNAFFMSLL